MWDELYKLPGSAGAFDAWLKTQKKPPDALFLASANARLGRNDQALAWLEKAREQRADLQMVFLAVDPGFDRLRSDPRFDAFLHRVGLPPRPKMIAHLCSFGHHSTPSLVSTISIWATKQSCTGEKQ